MAEMQLNVPKDGEELNHLKLPEDLGLRKKIKWLKNLC
jgi:hypothetical protein